MDSSPAEEKPKTSLKRKKVSRREGIETHTSPDEFPEKERSSSEQGTKSRKKSKVKSNSG